MQDLTQILEEWQYDSDQNVRIIVAEDGRSVLQVRLPLGIEQYEMEGRPDRRRPYDFESVLAYTEDRLRHHIFEHGGDAGFEIGVEDAEELQAEGILFYYRYLLLYQLQYFDLVVRDTEHNVHLCDLLERYCPDEEARNAVLQFRPYILRMHAAARAMGIQHGTLEGDAEHVLTEAIATIESLDEIESPAFQFEQVRSVNYLRSMLRTISEAADDSSSGSGSLRDELRDAIDREDYERAAHIRDRLRDSGGPGPGYGRVDKER
ncbi:MAG: UvrB/UvrC motif-containing protein [Alkalispirochaeta sp.]